MTARQKAQVDSIIQTVGPAMSRISDQEVLVSIVASLMMTGAVRFNRPEQFLDDARGFVDLMLAEMRAAS